jgi:hypothetical protein
MRSLVIVLALASAASAQEVVTSRDLEGATWGERLGKALALEGKFQGYATGEVTLAGVGAGKLVVDRATPDGERLDADLAGFRIGKTKLDRKGRSNVRITGVARDDPKRLVVSRVEKLEDDIERLRRLATRPGADLAALAREATALAREQDDPELSEWARARFEESLDGTRAPDAEAACQRARDYRDLAHVTSKAIASLVPYADDRRARALLDELGAVRHRDRWISVDELKAELGFVRSNGKWVTALHAELEAEVEKQRALARDRVGSLRQFTPRIYEKAGSEKRLLEGMFKAEVASVRGFPRSVERLTDSSGVTWDQWVFADGSRAYFTRAPGDESLLVSWR